MPSLRLLCSCAALLIAPSAAVTANPAVNPVPRAGEWWDTMHKEYADRAAKGGIDVLFLGDSITRYWMDPRRGKPVWDREFAPLKAVAFGIPGDRTQYVLWRLQNGEGQGYQPKAAVILIGTNNTGTRNRPAEAVEGITAVVEEVKRIFPAAKILLLGLLPRSTKDNDQRAQVAEINRALPKLHDGIRVHFLDIGGKFLDADGNIPTDVMPDLLHPNLKGYEIFADAIRQPLHDLLAK